MRTNVDARSGPARNLDLGAFWEARVAELACRAVESLVDVVAVVVLPFDWWEVAVVVDVG